LVGYHKPGESSAGPQIQNAWCSGDLGLALTQLSEPLGMKILAINSSGTQEASLAGGRQHIAERSGDSVVVGARHRRLPDQPAGEMTM
jgi:hypothetical protein